MKNVYIDPRYIRDRILSLTRRHVAMHYKLIVKNYPVLMHRMAFVFDAETAFGNRVYWTVYIDFFD